MPSSFPGPAAAGAVRSRRVIVGLLVLALAVVGLLAATRQGLPSAKAAAGGNVLLTGEKLLPEQSLVSPLGVTELKMQADGNLVLSIADRPGGPRTAYWATNINQPGSWLENQSDGNMVVFAPDGATLWTSKTGLCAGARLEVTDAPDFMDVFGADGSRLFWVYEYHMKHSTFGLHYGKKTAASCPQPMNEVAPAPPPAPAEQPPPDPIIPPPVQNYSSESD